MWLNCSAVTTNNAITEICPCHSSRVHHASPKNSFKVLKFDKSLCLQVWCKHICFAYVQLHGNEKRKMRGASRRMTKKCHETDSEVWDQSLPLVSSHPASSFEAIHPTKHFLCNRGCYSCHKKSFWKWREWSSTVGRCHKCIQLSQQISSNS